MRVRRVWTVLNVGLAGAAVIAVACATTQPPEQREPPRGSLDVSEPGRPVGGGPAHLPASLAQFFPPNTKAPVFLLEMFALEQPFTGIGIDLQPGDVEGAKANFTAFRAQYAKLAKMVPVEALGAALEGGDPGQVGPAMGRVGETCASCHAEYLIAANQQFHWLRFDRIQMTDPAANGEQVTYFDFMMRLASSYTGISNDLRQGQLDRAREHFQTFKQRFRHMADTACVACHESPRTYFVDSDVLQAIDRLGVALQANPPDGQVVQEIAMGIGMKSCMNCHLVHMPAAYAQRRTRE